MIAAVGLTIAVCLGKSFESLSDDLLTINHEAASQYGWDLHIWDVPEADIIPGRIVCFYLPRVSNPRTDLDYRSLGWLSYSS